MGWEFDDCVSDRSSASRSFDTTKSESSKPRSETGTTSESVEAPTSVSTSMGLVVVLFAVFFFYRWKSRGNQRMQYRELVPPIEPMSHDEDFSSFIPAEDDSRGVGHTYGHDISADASDMFGPVDDVFNNIDGDGAADVKWADWDTEKW